MFTIDQNITEAQLKEKDLCKALFSLNTHEVATPDMCLEEARSYVFFFREEKGRMSVYIGLHLLHTDRRLFYTHSANPFLNDVLPDLEDEARNFSEGLGALLDEADFAKMSDAEKKGWIADQSIFSRKKEPEPAPAEQEQLSPEPVSPPALVSPSAPAQSAPPQPVAAPVVPPVPPAQSAPVPPSASVPPSAPVQAVPTPQLVTPTPAPEPPDSDETAFEQQAFEPPPPKGSASAPLAAAAKKRRDIMDKAIKAGVAKPPKQSLARELTPPASIVSRDREALARLLTSF